MPTTSMLDEIRKELDEIVSKAAEKVQREKTKEEIEAENETLRERLSELRSETGVYPVREGGMGWEVEHDPIDYTEFLYDEVQRSNFGLDVFFEELTEGREYDYLISCYRNDEPQYVGRMVMPYCADYRLASEWVYVVRCHNNGTTYFTSLVKEALRTFCN